MNILTEDEIEQMALETLQWQGYETINGATIERAYNEVVLKERLQQAVHKLNLAIPIAIREEAIRNVLRVQHTTLLANNEAFHKQLTEGVDIKGRDGEQIKTFKV